MTLPDFTLPVSFPRGTPGQDTRRSGRGGAWRSLALCALVLGALGACGPTAPAEPESTLSTAEALPFDPRAVVKALGSSSTPYVSPALLVNGASPADAYNEAPTVAAGNGVYLVIWMEVVGSNMPDILGARVREDGTLLDSNPLRIGVGPNIQYQPSVAFDGTNFLVVWEEIESVPTIRGARVRPSDGEVLDSPALVIHSGLSGIYRLPQQTPAVAFDGTNYLVAWYGLYYEPATGSVSSGVRGIRVRPADGRPIESDAFLISRGGSAPRIAYGDTSYLVVWTRWGSGQASNVEAARIMPSGHNLDTTPLSIAATAADESHPTVAARRGEFLVAWTGADNTLFGRRVRAWDARKLDLADSVLGRGVTTPAEATFDGVDYRVTWQGTRDGVRKLFGTRVSPVGAVAPDAELALSEVSTSSAQARAGIAALASGRYLTAYLQHDAASGRSRIHARRVEHERATFSPELQVFPSSQAQREPVAAVGNDVYLLVWAQEVSTSRSDILGARIRASDGALLDASPILIGTGESYRNAPAVAFGGDSFLVVWSQTYQGPPTIQGARVRASDGALIDGPRRITGGPTFSPETTPAVAFDGTNYLVAWDGVWAQNGSARKGIQVQRVRASDGQRVEGSNVFLFDGGERPRVAYAAGRYLVGWQFSNQGYNAYGARIDATSGALLDSTPISLASTVADENNLSIASDGSQFLVTLRVGYSRVRSTRVQASDGRLLDVPSLILVESSATSGVVAFDGSDYRMAWLGPIDGRRVQLSARVSPLGLPAVGEEYALSGSMSTNWLDPAIAAAGPGRFLVAWSENDSAGTPHLRARLVKEGGEEVPEPCTEGTPTLVLDSGPELTLECGGGAYNDPGARAWDGCGNPIQVYTYNSGRDAYGPGPNTGAEGAYHVQYIAWDAMGNTVSAVRTVTVDDRVAPTLTLKGSERMTHTCGSQWVDPGVEALDACYGDVSATVVKVGHVNGWAPGTYTVRYEVRDSGGNSATPVTRTVEVANCPW